MTGRRRDEGEREGRSHGAALGVGGPAGFFTWRNRRAVRDAVGEVSPGTWRGALNVTAWFAGWLALSVIGSFWLPPLVAVVIGLVAMVLIGRWWDHRRAAERPSRPHGG